MAALATLPEKPRLLAWAGSPRRLENHCRPATCCSAMELDRRMKRQNTAPQAHPQNSPQAQNPQSDKKYYIFVFIL